MSASHNIRFSEMQRNLKKSSWTYQTHVTRLAEIPKLSKVIAKYPSDNSNKRLTKPLIKTAAEYSKKSHCYSNHRVDAFGSRYVSPTAKETNDRFDKAPNKSIPNDKNLHKSLRTFYIFIQVMSSVFIGISMLPDLISGIEMIYKFIAGYFQKIF